MTCLAPVATPAMAADDIVEVSDADIEAAIQRGVNWLKAQRNELGHWEEEDDRTDRHWGGTSALALLALLYAGENPREDELRRSLDWLAEQELRGTYVYGIRAHVLALAVQSMPRSEYRSRLESDLQWLLDAVWPRGSDHPGCFDYLAVPSDARSGRWDNSVSQYGVLGAWMAAEAGVNVPEWFWIIVGGHWLRVQNDDGGWGYQEGPPSTGSMTAAGLASLFVVVDRLWSDRPQAAGPYLGAIHRGLTWLGREYGAENPHGGGEWQYYYLYGVERAGHASGYKYYREKDWFRGGAEFLLRHQTKDGHWPASSQSMNTVRNTSFALMFLCHGRAPLLFNKLDHGAEWSGRTRDVAGLARYAGRTLERLINWQIVRLSSSMEDLLEAPVLYLYGEEAVKFDDVETQIIREYCQRGGLFLAVVGKDSDEYRRSIEALAKRAFPEYPLRPVDENHPLRSGDAQFVLDDAPPMLEVHNGVRTLMLLVRRDVARSWNKYPPRASGEEDYRFGCNLYLYATDKVTPRSRLQSPDIALVQRETRRTIHLARIKYDGQWDVEPHGWTRLKHQFNNELAVRLLVTTEVTLDSEDLDRFQIAHMTGTGAFELNTEELNGLRRFLAGGGTLIADAAGGSEAFLRSFEAHVREAAKSEPRALPPDSFLLAGSGIPGAVDLAGTTYRRRARSAGRGEEYPRLRVFESRRRYSVIYSPLDLSAGLLGTQVYGLRGYEPDSVLRIMRNLLLYADLSNTVKAELHRAMGEAQEPLEAETE